MALSDWGRYLVFSMATQLWSQDWIMNHYTHGSAAGKNLRDMVLARQPVKPLTNPFDEAITGRLRADSRALMQNARNVREAGAMVDMAASAVGSIKTALEEMQALAMAVDAGDMTAGAAAGDYNALRDKITSIIKHTQFNGIHLLDDTAWGTDQIDTEGKVYVQGLVDGGFDVSLQKLPQSDLAHLSGAHLADPGDLQTELDALSGLVGDMDTLSKLYTKRADGLKHQATTLESQAEFLQQAVEARRQEPTKSIEDIVLEMLTRKSGTLMDEHG
ncbi:flagellin [Desulfovibrionales bacterium]